MKLLRKFLPDPRQLSLQLDFFSSDAPSAPPSARSPAPSITPAPPSPPAPFIPAVPLPPHAAQPLLPSVPEANVPPPLAPGLRRLQLGDLHIDYAFARSKRRSIGFVIDDDGLRITAPKWISMGEVENAIREKQRWIFAKLNERRERSARRLKPQMRWCDGGTLPYLGDDITLRIRSVHHAPVSYDEQTRELILCLPSGAGEQQLKDRVQSWLQREAHRIFAERLPLYADKLGVRFHSFRLSSAQTQWGSCTAEGKIRLNWRLVHFALPQIDYVIAHELAHLREMNHSPAFWATVQSVFPEFEAAKRVLRDRAPDLLPEF